MSAGSNESRVVEAFSKVSSGFGKFILEVSDHYFDRMGFAFSNHKDTKIIKEGGLSRPPTTRNAFMTTSVLFFVNFVSSCSSW